MRSLRAPVVLSLVLLLLGVLGIVSSLVGSGFTVDAARISLLGAQTTLGLAVDGVSAVLLTFIGGLALITAEYSRRNLRGQARLDRYSAWHMTAAGSLALLVTGASLPLLALGWTISAIAIARLVGHRGAAASRLAARYVRRRLAVADALLWSAVVVAAATLDSLDRADLATVVPSADGTAVTLTALLLVGAALVRSSLLPGHRWLFETAEAPSPVSALLHAGVVNAVGLLGVLLWPVFAGSAAARGLLIVAGAATAVAMSVAIAFRADVKGRLAASTSAQMGYLAIQVGLGLPLAGMLHLIGHGSYKAHLFLRAGGEIARTRTSLASPRRVRPGTALVALVIAGLATAVGLQAWPAVPLADALPIAVAGAAAAIAIVAVLAPGTGLRPLVRPASTLAASGTVALLLVAYLAVLSWWTGAFPGFAGAAGVWSGPALAAWFSLLIAGLAAALALPRLLRAGRLPALRAYLGAMALPPVARVHRALRADAPPAAPSSDRPGAPPTAAEVGMAVAAATAVVAPMWPLRSAVAANPLAGLQDLDVHEAGAIAGRTWGARTLADHAAYLRAYRAGRITEADLRAAAAAARGNVGEHGADMVAAVLLAITDAEHPADPLLRSAVARRLNRLSGGTIGRLNTAAAPVAPYRTLTEQWDAATGYLRAGIGCSPLTQVADGHANSWTLDLLAAPGAQEHRPGELWRAWRARVSAPGLDRTIGTPGLGAAAAELPDEPLAALSVLLARVPVGEHIAYLGRLLARNPGWPAHLAWRTTLDRPDLRGDLLAIRATYDVLLRASVIEPPTAGTRGPDQRASQRVITATAQALHRLGLDAEAVAALDGAEIEGIASLAASLRGTAGAQVWQAALEQRYRNRMLDRIEARTAAGPDASGRPATVHLAMCIDVRSERFRRHLESQDAGVATYGFAGFFGLPIRHRPSAGPATDQCPVLLRPSTEIAEELHPFAVRRGMARLLGGATNAATGATAAPFAVAEAAAPVAGALALAQTVAPRAWRRARDWTRGPATAVRGRLDLEPGMDPAQQIAAARSFLHSIGVQRLHGSLMIVAGHGAAVENNAYAAAYDCGACGGNAGYVNARIMAAILNRPEVRAGLAEQGIPVDPDLVAVPALHVTTTDELHIDEADVPASAAAALQALRGALARSTADSAAERVALLPGGRAGDAARDVARRASDWAEATPEWGLAGNALFVAGPRWMTTGLNLHGRSFLHSYDPAVDTDRSVLEAILTAPLVVAHWINSQYYASTVDPVRFGAEDKTTHNVVGDFAVLSGAHGDLRVGLPWQSLFDNDPVTGTPGIGHEPMRLQAVVYARGADVLAILHRHPQVLRLVTGEWLSLAVIEPSDASLHRLTPALRFEAWDLDPLGVDGAVLPRAQAVGTGSEQGAR